LNPRPHEAQLEDQNPKKSSRRSSRRRKIVKPTNGKRSGKPKKKQREAEKLKLKTPPNFLNANSPPPPQVEFIMFSTNFSEPPS
jgi:hypothetical protein